MQKVFVALLTLACHASAAELNINALRFANRAQCAVDSEKPTQSVFLSIDTYNAGRLGFNFGKKMKVDATAMAQTFTAEYQTRLFDFVKRGLTVPHSCYVVSRFSELQAPLHTTKIDKDMLNGIAKAAADYKSTMTPCEEFQPTGQEKDLLLSLNVLVSEKQWESQGFEFWKNFKFKLSKEWRGNSGTVQFESLLKTVDLEESVMLFSQNCYSVTEPRCDQQALAIHSVRDFAKPKESFTDLDTPLPKIPSDLIVKRGSRGVNDDFLHTQNGRLTEDWLGNLKNQKKEQTWIFRNKLLNSSQFLHLLTTYTSPDSLIENVKPSIKDPASAEQLAAVCLEWRLASDTKINFLGKRIHTLLTTPALLNKLATPYGVNLTKAAEYFEKADAGFQALCDKIEEDEFLHTHELKWTRVSPWAQEILKSYNFEAATEASPALQLKERPYLFLAETESTICETALDCSQKLIKSMVDLYLVSEYYDTFWNGGEIKSPAMFNPYDELSACKIYDPWFVKQRTLKVFAGDLTSTALFGWNAIPFYVDMTYTFPKVTSLKAVLDSGAVKYNPQLRPSEARGAFLVDFGPLVGAPCAVQISESGKPFNFYAFSGLSVNYCNQRINKNVSVTGADDASVSDGKALEFCGGCTLSFTSVGSAAAVTVWPAQFNPVKLGFYLFRSFYRLTQGMADSHNIPRALNIDVPQLLEIYKNNPGGVPETCVEQFKQWGNCDPRREMFNLQGEKGA